MLVIQYYYTCIIVNYYAQNYCAYPLLQACSLLACVTCFILLVFIVIEYLRLRKHESRQRAEYKYRNYDSL